MTSNDTGAPQTCPNCGAEVTGNYCPECGQRRGEEVVPSLGTWLRESADELLFVEARLLRTLRALAWPPGHLSQEWWSGRRRRYITPLRVYLMVAIPFFFLLTLRNTGDRPMGFLQWAVEAAYLTTVDSGVPAVASEPMPPLPAELQADSAARADWQMEFERRQAANRANWRELEGTLGTGVGRVLEVLPVAVALFMVPLLGALVFFGLQPRPRLVVGLVFSLHVHAVAYTLTALGWIFGHGALTGWLGGAVYGGVAFRRLTERSILESGVRAALVASTYAAGFAMLYVGLVVAMSRFAPQWVFGAP